MKSVTIKDVAKKAGVSISVVSYVLNNNPNVSISDKTRKKVIDAAKSLNYTPSSIARSMRTKKSMIICLASFWDVSDSVFTDVLKGIDHVAEKNNYTVTYCNIKDNSTSLKIVDLYKQRQIDGVILLLHVDPAKNFNEEEFINTIKQNAIPTVIINGQTEDPDISYVYIDYYGTTYTAINYLHALGHKRFAYMLPQKSEISNIQAIQRMNGYKAAIKNLNLTNSDLFFTKETINDILSLLQSENKPTAIIANKTDYAAFLLKFFMENNIRVPDDISVIASNDQKIADFLIPALTTVKIPTYEIGKKSADILFDILQGKSSNIKLKLPNKIVERKSHMKL